MRGRPCGGEGKVGGAFLLRVLGDCSKVRCQAERFWSSEIPSCWILIFKDKVGEITRKSVVANLCIAFQKYTIFFKKKSGFSIYYHFDICVGT